LENFITDEPLDSNIAWKRKENNIKIYFQLPEVKKLHVPNFNKIDLLLTPFCIQKPFVKYKTKIF